MTEDDAALLARLDEAHAAATASEWIAAKHDAYPQLAALVRRQAAALAAVETLAQGLEALGGHGPELAAHFRAALAAGDDGQATT